MSNTAKKDVQTPEVCDYTGSTYRADFWEGKGREYEDAVERIAIRSLLPKEGRRYIDFGAGFGRLINEAANYEQVVVMDYSLTMLQDAQSRLGRSDRYIYVAADLYRLPFAPNTFDVALMCRVIHHLADAPLVLKQIRASMTSGATFVLEYANKRNLKAILRYLLRKQEWSPFSEEPIEFVKLNFDFHPQYMSHALKAAGFTTVRQYPVSWLRLGIFKKLLPLNVMVLLDRLLQQVGRIAPVSPSIFTQNRVPGDRGMVAPVDSIFKCPQCGGAVERQDEAMVCVSEGKRWAIRDGIYDFKEPI
ncbi:MAG: class I SAM-dependent methyltransferase [Anaerolineae bacterium]|nr:class I SAM-dependent methyltransferase [Anaerolineae bacterium]